MSETILTCPKAYDWAYNKMKLNYAYTAVVKQNKADPKFAVSEENIKERYIQIKGLTTTEQKKAVATPRPRSTSNIDKVVRK